MTVSVLIFTEYDALISDLLKTIKTESVFNNSMLWSIVSYLVIVCVKGMNCNMTINGRHHVVLSLHI